MLWHLVPSFFSQSWGLPCFPGEFFHHFTALPGREAQSHALPTRNVFAACVFGTCLPLEGGVQVFLAPFVREMVAGGRAADLVPRCWGQRYCCSGVGELSAAASLFAAALASPARARASASNWSMSYCVMKLVG
jgi:hypothetical protein